MITQARSILPIGIMTAIGCGDRAYGTAATIPAATPPAPAVATRTIRGTGTGLPPVSPGGNSSSWDYVILEKGVTQP